MLCDDVVAHGTAAGVGLAWTEIYVQTVHMTPVLISRCFLEGIAENTYLLYVVSCSAGSSLAP